MPPARATGPGPPKKYVCMLRRTRPPKKYVAYIDTEHTAVEIERRAGATVAERFEPLVVVSWRSANEYLHQLWPEPVDDIVQDTSALAAGLEVSSFRAGLTPPSVPALEQKLMKLLPFATPACNAARCTEVLEAFRKGDETATGTEAISAEASTQLQSDVVFQALKTDMAAVNATDHVATCKLLMQYPQGILFLNHKFAPDKCFIERS